MAYTICGIDKMKTKSDFKSRYKHNYREYDVANADGSMSHLNMEVIGLNGKKYEDIYEEELLRIAAARHYKKTVRRDAVRGLEVMLSYSYDDKLDIPLNEWIEKSVEWLNEEFNPEGNMIQIEREDGTVTQIKSDNVKSVMVHLDEAVPHIHAFIVPIDNKGNLNAKFYTGNRILMQQHQTNYAKAMAEFGLKRGTQNQLATRKDIARYHSELKETVSAELPPVREGETAHEYRERANKEYQREKIHHRNDVMKHRQKVKEVRSDALMDRIENNNKEEMLARQVKKLGKEFGTRELDQEDVRVIRRYATKARDFEEAVREYPDKETAKQLLDNYNKLVEWKRKKDKEKQRDNNEPKFKLDDE